MAAMFQYLITVSPLGLMYGSAGAFLSPENLVGRSGAKFPPDAAALAGLFFSANHASDGAIADHTELTQNLYVAGPFWAKRDEPEAFYVPMPRHRLIAEQDEDEWRLEGNKVWQRDPEKADLAPAYGWQSIDAWQSSTRTIRENQAAAKPPWEYVSFLHPKLKPDERHVVDRNGLFLENAVQLDADYCLVYISTYALPAGWYRFGGEGHMVEIESHSLENSKIQQLLNQKIQRACALITPAAWGSTQLSYRYPRHPEFPREGLKLLTDKPIPYRYRTGNRKTERGRLSRGRYAVPAGSVYVFKQPLDKTWWEFSPEWFPEKGLLKKMGCGLCLPIEIEGVA
jgi:CRISPR-associated protein Cmr3